ncbi:unnamed protein product, partial [Owenia fusiformis]
NLLPCASFSGLMTGARTCDLMVRTINPMKTSEVNITWRQAECKANVTDTFMCVKIKKDGPDQATKTTACPARRPCSCTKPKRYQLQEGEINCENVELYTMPIGISLDVKGVFARKNKIRYIENGMFHGMPNLK